jgi:predicted GIY-YIG superfamily endonuclease
MIDGFSQPHHVQGRDSIADLFPSGKRCGLYILQFSDGEIYAGQALDVTRRYVQHRKVHCDIEKISFKRVAKKTLNEEERTLIWMLEHEGYRLRNITFTSIPRGEQEGEISFCAYNTGIGWRNIIEHMHQNATVAQWYKEQGRHEVFARNKEVALSDSTHNLILNEVDLARPNKPEMEGPKTAAEEMQMMKKLYQEMLLEKNGIKGENLVQIGGIKRKKKDDTNTVSA